MPNRLDEIRHEIALASRMLAHENVLDAFGHVSMRHPTDPGRYFLSRSRSPQLIEPSDILEYTLDSEPVKAPSLPMFAERVIHGCLYAARPDVMAVCHHHAAAVLPFCVAGVPIEPVFHLGAATGETTPFWDQQEEFGDTNLLVRTPEEGRSHARALGNHSALLLNRHGATVVGADIRELVSRCVFMCQNATYQLQAHMLGKVDKLSPGEVKLASTLNSLPNVTGRTWSIGPCGWRRPAACRPRRSRSHRRKRAAHRPRRHRAARNGAKSSARLTAAKHRSALFQERAHALGIIGRQARLALEFAFEVELGIEVVLPGLVERAFDQCEPERRGRGEVLAELVCLRQELVVRQRLPDHAPAFRLLRRHRLGGQRQRAGARRADQAWQDPGAARSGTRPILANDCTKFALRAARTMSQASAMLQPAPAATPLTAATTGNGSPRSFRTSGL